MVKVQQKRTKALMPIVRIICGQLRGEVNQLSIDYINQTNL